MNEIIEKVLEKYKDKDLSSELTRRMIAKDIKIELLRYKQSKLTVIKI